MTIVLSAPERLRAALLSWYDENARTLPWRVGPGERRAGARPDPYRVWLSEIMLQQTTTAHAGPYFMQFLERWPSVGDLARAEDAEVMSAWAGLGYYARARNLLACAREVAGRLGGRFPQTEEELRRLPGVGVYTAAAIAAIAFDRPANVVDGNVERVVSRLFALGDPPPAAKRDAAARASSLVDPDRPGDWAQALMDLGATVCSPRRPTCRSCPLSELCAARAAGDPERYPAKVLKSARPRRFGVAYVGLRAGRTALVRRPAKGLLGGMLALPTGPWRAEPAPEALVREEAPVAGAWRDMGTVEHVFTHFALSLRVFACEPSGEPPGAIWTPHDTALASMPSAFRKALAQALHPDRVSAARARTTSIPTRSSIRNDP